MAKAFKDKEGYIIECPGCGHAHLLDDRWTFNGDLEEPTFSPSLLVRSIYKGEPTVCHSFITKGRIQFLSDCTHELKSTTVYLEEITGWE